MIEKPMLAGSLDDAMDARFPLLATPKLDGIRCLMVNDKALSRKFKSIPNNHIRTALESSLNGLTLDGELMIPNAPFNEVSSAVMSQDGEPNFEYWVFDCVSALDKPYHKRMEELGALALPKFCKKVLPVAINNIHELLQLEETWLAQGFEGVMIRSMTSPYKNGRSTLREHYLLKLKRFADSEAIVLAMEERLHNANEATIDELGHTKRSKHQANMIPDGALGAFVVRDLKTNVEFRVSTGMDDALRKSIWDNQKDYVGKIVKYKYQPSGMKDLPRFPVFLGFRDERDM